jgi:hypothetical protein
LIVAPVVAMSKMPLSATPLEAAMMPPPDRVSVPAAMTVAPV